MIGVKVTGGVARFGEGDVLALSAAQYKARAEKLEIAKHDKKHDAYVVKVKASIEFKSGELLGVPSIDKRLEGVLALQDHPAAEPAAAA